MAGFTPSPRGVGSKRTQPWVGIQTSTQAWALRSLTTTRPSSHSHPGVKPRTTRLGRPTRRAMTAMAVANCSQYPVWKLGLSGSSSQSARSVAPWPGSTSIEYRKAPESRKYASRARAFSKSVARRRTRRSARDLMPGSIPEGRSR